MNPLLPLAFATFATMLAAAARGVPVDLSRFAPGPEIHLAQHGDTLRVEWPGDEGRRTAVTFSLEPVKPLFATIESGDVVVARDVRPVFTVTTGSRVARPNERYTFFDKPASRPTRIHEAVLDVKSVRVEGTGDRVAILFGGLSAGPFTGDLIVRLYAGSPFIQVEAAMSLEQDRVAYIYDFVLDGQWSGAAWKENVNDTWMRAALDGEPRAVAVRNRTIFGETTTGSVAVFPPPHAFFFPRDYTVNFKFAQVGHNRFGLRQDPAGGPGHEGAYIPWFDAPPGRTQRMSAFVLASAAKPEAALERIKRYTHGDSFVPIAGRFTFTSHWHVRLTANELAGTPAGPEAVKVFKALNVNLVHLAEFHGDGNPADPGPQRLPQLKAMFDVCRKYSDDRLVFIPGEEANAQLNQPPAPGTQAGHWLYLFPKPVFLTLVRGEGVPFVEDISPYGMVYHAGSEADMVEILRREHALAWTAHPRIKASADAPDAYKNTAWYKSDLWLGAGWKAMPGDLSESRLGKRALDVLDDMNTWGQRKQVVGEVDTFALDSTHETYGHMNINYVALDQMPKADDWSPVLGALRRGDFFTTTGEVLIHSFAVQPQKVTADIEWTFPLSQLLLVSWDGREITRRVIPISNAREFERRTFELPLEGSPQWVRLEAWDIATNGAFTQPQWR